MQRALRHLLCTIVLALGTMGCAVLSDASGLENSKTNCPDETDCDNLADAPEGTVISTSADASEIDFGETSPLCVDCRSNEASGFSPLGFTGSEPVQMDNGGYVLDGRFGVLGAPRLQTLEGPRFILQPLPYR